MYTFGPLSKPLRIGGDTPWRVAHAAVEGAEQARFQVPTRASATVPREFDHPEAVPTPPGGGPAG